MVEKANQHLRVTTVSLPKSLADQVDGFRFERRLPSQAEAIRQLLKAGLAHVKETKRGSSS